MLHPSHYFTHSHTHTHTHIYAEPNSEAFTHISESSLCTAELAVTYTVQHLHYSTVQLWVHSEHQLMDCLCKTEQTNLYTFELVPAQRLSLLFKHPSVFPQTSGVHIRTNILDPTSSAFHLLQQPTYKSVLYHPLSLCYISFTSTVCLHYYFTCTSAESQRCDGEGMLIYFPQVRPHTCPSHAESKFRCSNAEAQWVDLSL